MGGDCETDHDDKTAWIVQWAISDGVKATIGTTLDELTAELIRLLSTEETTYLYFHNLKYDLEFIKYAIYDIQVTLGIVPFIMFRENSPISIKLEGLEGSGYSTLHIRDSLKKFVGTVSDLGRMVNLPKLDAGTDFQPGWSKKINLDDNKQWDYVKRDAQIVALAMQKLHALGADKSTSSGDAWKGIKESIGSSKDGTVYYTNYRWRTHFPHLSLALDKLLRPGYFGGINVSQHQGYITGPITHIDVNSMYPAVMYYDELPHGFPRISSRPPRDGKLYVRQCSVKLNLKPGAVPIYMFKNGKEYLYENQKPGTPVVKCDVFHELTLTNIDIDNLSRFYEMEFDPDYKDVYIIFKKCVGLFRDHIDKYQAVKKASKKGTAEYYHSKFMQNQPYGRFALSPEGQETTLIEDENGELVWHKVPTTAEDLDAYLPYAMFITAHARRRLCDGIIAVGSENVIHCDTDSIIYKGDDNITGIKIGNELGEWSIENQPKVMFEGGFKRYIELSQETPSSIKDINMACAGVPRPINDAGVPVGMWIEILDDPSILAGEPELGNPEYSIKSEWLRKIYINNGMNPDKVNTMKLLPKRVPGGWILTEHKHKLSKSQALRLRFT